MSQTDVAHESYVFWRPLVRRPYQAWALLGSESGETGFIWKVDAEGKPYTPPGDNQKAHGIAQWHDPRADDILKGCGIDVRKAGHLDQLRAQHFEMTKGAYRKVWPLLMASESLWSAVSVLVHDFERSGQQARDIKRRVALAEQLQAAHGADWEKAA